MTDTPPGKLPVDDWPLPPDLRSLLDRFAALDLRAGLVILIVDSLPLSRKRRQLVAAVDAAIRDGALD